MRKSIFVIGIMGVMVLGAIQLIPSDKQKSTVHADSNEAKEIQDNGKRELNFNADWRFKLKTDDSLEDAMKTDFDDSDWRQLDLPHDWSIEQDFNKDSAATYEGGYLDGGTGWYRKKFTIPESMKDKQISVNFDGVFMNSTVYLNGKKLGTYPYGYNSFSYDLNQNLNKDGKENVLAVKVDNKQPSSRWYSGSGIYRNVHLTATDKIHVTRNGTFVRTPDLKSTYKNGKANVKIQTEVANKTDKKTPVTIKSMIQDEDNQTVADVQSDKKTIKTDDKVTFADTAVINDPELWDIDNPYRYTLVTEVVANGDVVDTYKTKFGARYFDFVNKDGFSLNGKKMKLHGMSMHHDNGALGAVENSRAVDRQMQKLKKMGVNAVRSTHNPASPEMLEAANKEGLVVIDEAFDAWNQTKKTYDYSRFFSKHSDRFDSTWAEHDIKQMVDDAKNEPSVIMWSLGNEIEDTATEEGVKTAKNLNKWVKEIDKSRPTTIGENKDEHPINPNVEKVLDTVDVVGLNYSEGSYDAYHKKHPDWKIYGSETSSATRTRGVYTHPYQDNVLTKYDDLQQSSYDNDYVSWGLPAEEAWKQDRDRNYIGGQFIWTGFDYIGEPTPYYDSYPAKSSYFGVIDTAGFPKDIFYYYQSQWTDKPMVHLLPHWNWNKGDKVRVLAYTNADKVELRLNGKSLGERHYKTQDTENENKETKDGETHLEWKVPFESGTLEAIAKDKNGKVIAKDKVETAGKPAKIKLSADRENISADGVDLSYITADIVDKDGHVVPDADNKITFNQTGNGKLAGVDNGNPASVERYKDDKRKAFHGKALAILQADEKAGDIKLQASAKGIKGDSITISTKSSDTPNVNIASMIDYVEQSEADGVIDDKQIAHKLKMQLRAVDHYADSGSKQKASKHMKHFKVLVKDVLKKGSINHQAADQLDEQASILINKWKH